MNDPVDVQHGITLPFELTPAAVSEWIDELPVLNTVQTAEKLYRALAALSQLKIEPMLRFQLIERMRNTIYLLSKGLEKYFIDASFPLQKKEHKLSKLSTHLHRELVSNYTLLTENDACAELGSFSPSQKETIIERALYSLSLEQLMIAQRYEACSTRFWVQLYRLITLSERLQLLSSAEKDNPLGQLVKRLLLFSLSSPNRFSQREIKALYILLERQAELTQLGSQPINRQEQKAGFFIDLESAQPPQHTSRLEIPNTTLRYLHANNLVDQLISQFKQLASNQHSESLSTNKRTLGKVIRSLAAPEYRKYKRLNSEPAECTVILGLENIIKSLSESNTSDSNKAKRTQKIIKPVRARELWDDIPDFGIMPLDNSHNSMVTSGNSARDEGLAYNQLKMSKNHVSSTDIWGKEATRNSPTKISAFGCKVIDISRKGLQLLWAKEGSAKVKVGEIVAIFQENLPVKAGIVRRVAQDENTELSFGIELLSTTIQLITISSPKQPDSEIKGLLIPEQPQATIQQSLLIPPSKYQTGGWVDIKEKSATRRYRLQKLLETSPSFEQFSLFKLDNCE